MTAFKKRYYRPTTSPSETKVIMDSADKFVGVIIDKTHTKAVCTATEDYVRADGDKTILLVWLVELKGTDKKKTVKTSSSAFRIGDIPATKKAFE